MKFKKVPVFIVFKGASAIFDMTVNLFSLTVVPLRLHKMWNRSIAVVHIEYKHKSHKKFYVNLLFQIY